MLSRYNDGCEDSVVIVVKFWDDSVGVVIRIVVMVGFLAAGGGGAISGSGKGGGFSTAELVVRHVGSV